MANYTQTQVNQAILNFGKYRTLKAQTEANSDGDGVGGGHLIAIGLRETGLRNIRGGVVWNEAEKKWIKQPDYHQQDVGWLQISQKYHEAALKLMPGVREGTWAPLLDGKTAADPGCCPRFTDALRYTIDEMHEAIAYADDHGVNEEDLPRFAIAAHNAGIGGALSGYKRGNVDMYTTGKDYSAWVLYHTKLVRVFLKEHPSYKVS